MFLGLNVLRLWFCTLIAAGETKCKYSWRLSLGHLFKLLLMSWCRFSGRLGTSPWRVWTCLLTPKPNWRLCRDMSSFQFNSDVVSQIPNCTVKKSCQLGRDEDKLQDLTLCKALEYKKFTLWKQLHYIYSCFPVNDTVNKWCLLILWVIEHTYTLHPLPTPPKQDTATFICLFLTKSQFNK